MEKFINQIYNEDCIAGMNRIPDKRADMILTDLPYNITGLCSSILSRLTRIREI